MVGVGEEGGIGERRGCMDGRGVGGVKAPIADEDVKIILCVTHHELRHLKSCPTGSEPN